MPLLVPSARVAMSTASAYPESTASAFEIAARLGYDGVAVYVVAILVFFVAVAALLRVADGLLARAGVGVGAGAEAEARVEARPSP